MQTNTPTVPTDPRQCRDCGRMYWVLTKTCPTCGSTRTRFVEERTLRPSNGFGELTA